MKPELNKTYKFYDDGKISRSRQYDAKVIRIIEPEEAETIMFDAWYDPDSDYEYSTFKEKRPPEYKLSLYEVWDKHIEEDKGYLYADVTDLFVGCSIPDFDDDIIWFVRTKDGGWFSMDIQNCWQGGRLDVENKFKI